MKREFLTDEQVEAGKAGNENQEQAAICWDSPCDFGKPICCLQCEAFHGCIQSCDQTDCETWKEFEQDDEENDD